MVNQPEPGYHRFMQQTIPFLLDRACDQFGDQPYLSDRGPTGWSALSFVQTRETAWDVACALIRLGLPAGCPAVIMSEGRSAWVIAELAVLHLGGVCVPISLKLLADEVPFRVNHSEARVVFFSRLT